MDKSVIKGTLVAVAMFAASQAQASVMQVETGFSNSGALSSAELYRSVVNSAIANPTQGYGSTSVAVYDNVSNNALFGGTSSEIAFKSTINFGVTQSNAGLWDLRSGVDFGGGGAVFLDGVALGYKSNDMWWSGSYNDPSQFFQYSVNLAQGNHTLNFYGLENCCDGGQQAQFRSSNATSFQTFSSADGLIPAVPEPETYAMLLLGAGLIGSLKRRQLRTRRA